jgi:hypothetical protein
MKRQFYMNNEKVDEKQCNKNRCCCLIVQYAIQNGIKYRTKYIPKQGVEKIGFYGVNDSDALSQAIYEFCEKCK